MKKTNIFLLTILTIVVLFVSCNSEIHNNEFNDEVFGITALEYSKGQGENINITVKATDTAKHFWYKLENESTWQEMIDGVGSFTQQQIASRLMFKVTKTANAKSVEEATVTTPYFAADGWYIGTIGTTWKYLLHSEGSTYYECLFTSGNADYPQTNKGTLESNGTTVVFVTEDKKEKYAFYADAKGLEGYSTVENFVSAANSNKAYVKAEQGKDLDAIRIVGREDGKGGSSYTYKKNVGEDYNTLIKNCISSNSSVQKALDIPLSIANDLLDKYTFGLGTTVLGIFFQADKGTTIVDVQKQVETISKNVNEMRAEMNQQFIKLNGLVSQSTTDIENLITTNVEQTELKSYLNARKENEVNLNAILVSYNLMANDPSAYPYFTTFADEFFGKSFITSQNQREQITSVILKYFNPINGNSAIPGTWKKYYESKNLYRWGSNLSVRTQMLIESKYALTARVLTDAVLNPQYPNVKIYYAQNSVLAGTDSFCKTFYNCTWEEFWKAVCPDMATDEGWKAYRASYQFTDASGKVRAPVDVQNNSMVNPSDSFFNASSADYLGDGAYNAFRNMEDFYIFQEYQNKLIEEFLVAHPKMKVAMESGYEKLKILYEYTMQYIDGFVDSISSALSNLPQDEKGWITLNFVNDNTHEVYYVRLFTNIDNPKTVDEPMSFTLFSDYHKEPEDKRNGHTLVKGDLTFTGTSGLQELPYWYSACMLNSKHFEVNGYTNNNCGGIVSIKASAETLSEENQTAILLGNVVAYKNYFDQGAVSKGALYKFEAKNNATSITELKDCKKKPAYLFSKDEMLQIMNYFGTSGYCSTGLKSITTTEGDNTTFTYAFNDDGEMSYDCNIGNILSKAFGISIPTYSHTYWDGCNRKGTEFEKETVTEYITVTAPIQYTNLSIFVPVTGDDQINLGPNTFTVRGVQEGSIAFNKNPSGDILNLDDCITTVSDYEAMMKLAFVTPCIQNWDSNTGMWVSAD